MSTVTAWRLTTARRVAGAWSGEGAYRRGGRWNLPGSRMVYCAESRALAALEVLVHVEEVNDLAGLEWRIISLAVPIEFVEQPARFPDDWRDYPYPMSTQVFGSEWLKSARSLALRVPSAVVLGEFNYLINPAHPGFSKIAIGKPEPFAFDPRLK